MAVLHAPSVTITAAPFTVLLASMTCFAVLARRIGAGGHPRAARRVGLAPDRPGTVTVARAAGGGFLRRLQPHRVGALPRRFETLESRYLRTNSSSRLTVSAEGLWLRQAGERGRPDGDPGQAAPSGRYPPAVGGLGLPVRPLGTGCYRRMDARTAVLEHRAWRLNGVQRWDLIGGRQPRIRDAALVETAAVSTDADAYPHGPDGRAYPRQLRRPSDHQFLGASQLHRGARGARAFSSARHKMHWYGLLSAPVVFVAMVLIGRRVLHAPCRASAGSG